MNTGKYGMGLRYGWKSPLTWIWLVCFIACAVAGVVILPNEQTVHWQVAVMAVALAVGFLGAEFRWNIIDDFFRRHPVIVLPLLAAGNFFQMEASNENPFTSLKAAGALWSFLAALCVYLILYALTNRAWLSGMLGALLFTIWALVNYFTLQFRGTPVSPGDMFSAGTAMDMVQSGKYHLSFSGTVLLILVIFLMQSSLIISVFGREGKRNNADKNHTWNGVCGSRRMALGRIYDTAAGFSGTIPR